ncbi:MAG: DGQHR domain-containing protein, partial [Nitrospira sp.]|nr:DGQHR domain-containing protein [Nitrospira sp.]
TAFSPWRANARPSLFQPAQANPGGGITRAESHLSTACNLFKETEPPLTLQKDIQETISLQSYIRTAIHSRFLHKAKPKLIWIYVTNNTIWSVPDIERAEDGKIEVITENELQYFETFVKHMGPAAKYQILGEFLKGQKVPGLANVRLPAIRGEIGGEKFYSFVSTPRNLLKIAFINHQALNHPDGRPAYQRMISASRIKEIGEFIMKGGFFPTNILVNFSDAPRFDLISNRENTDSRIKFGWLTLPSKYRSAWIIDGQHRLYGFSRLTDAYLDQSLFVLAFENMNVQKEADLFVTINHKQKNVPKSLLVSLLADIRMGSGDPSTALLARASGVVRKLNIEKSSPLVRRFATPGVPPEPSQNLTISETVNGLRRSGLIGKLSGKTLAPGPLMAATDEETVDRAASVLGAYFEKVREANPKRWEGGRGDFIATNPGIRAHLSIIGEVVSYLSYRQSLDFELMTPDKFSSHISAFCQPLFDFIRTAPDDVIKAKFSRRFGEGGVKEYTYYLMEILTQEHHDFGTEEFQTWAQQRDSEKIDDVNQFLMKLAERLTNFVIDTLKQVHGIHRLPSDEPAFWEIGVESDSIRKKAFEKQQKDRSRRKPKEAYLDIVDLPEIVKQKNNWHHFEHVFKNPRPNERSGQKYYMGWVNTFNDLRNIAAHKNQLKTYSDEDLEFVDWLRTEVSPKVPE